MVNKHVAEIFIFSSYVHKKPTFLAFMTDNITHNLTYLPSTSTKNYNFANKHAKN